MNTNIIPPKTHAYIDYITAASLLTLPLVFGGKKKGAETYLPLAMGAGVLMQSLLTGYDSHQRKEKMNMDTHLKLDYAGGALLALSPFLFGFRKRSWAPHLLMGVSELAIALFTKPKQKKKLFGIFG